ncbi:polysaccharide deacetylase family protein [Candidatus Sumerlaeota bacterium]|nr:polysaccharide deacetylase family protein [Candidatus Sumerlaeota bacterium]
MANDRNIILCCDCEGTERELARIFKVLSDCKVDANFFFVGETVKAFPKLVRDIAAQFQAESHTMTHPNLRTLSYARQKSEITGGRKCVEDCIQRPTHGFRAPMHHMNRDTVRILNEENFLFDASRLYFRYDMGKVVEIDPTWFREWMPLYEQLGLKPRTAFGWFRLLSRCRSLCVLPVHPQYSGKNAALADGLRWFINDAKASGARFWRIDDWIAAKGLGN